MGDEGERALVMTKRVDLTLMRLLEGVGPAAVWAALAAIFLWFGGYKVLEADVVALEGNLIEHKADYSAHRATARNIEIRFARMEATLESIDKRLERMEQ